MWLIIGPAIRFMVKIVMHYAKFVKSNNNIAEGIARGAWRAHATDRCAQTLIVRTAEGEG